VTIPGAPQGFNCLMVIRKYGSKAVRCLDVAYGLNIGSTEDEAAARRVYYPLNQYIAAYDLILAFATLAERDAFNNWLQTYMARAASNQNIGGYVYVQVPAREVAFNGIPLGPLMYGDTVPNDLYYPTTVRFIGAVSPVSGVGVSSSLAGVSQFRLPSKDTTDAPHFYPGGTQKSGATSLAGTLYDPSPPPVTLPPQGGGPIGSGPGGGTGGGGGTRDRAE
jgi:hypothetical protein